MRLPAMFPAYLLLAATLLAASGASRCAGAAAPAPGQAVAAPADDAMQDNVSLADYLALLERIAPAARSGAERYLAAYRDRCRAELGVFALRQAFVAGTPALLAMIRAGADNSARGAVAAMIVCRGSR